VRQLGGEAQLQAPLRLAARALPGDLGHPALRVAMAMGMGMGMGMHAACRRSGPCNTASMPPPSHWSRAGHPVVRRRTRGPSVGAGCSHAETRTAMAASGYAAWAAVSTATRASASARCHGHVAAHWLSFFRSTSVLIDECPQDVRGIPVT
jgi:hypothetical protein